MTPAEPAPKSRAHHVFVGAVAAVVLAAVGAFVFTQPQAVMRALGLRVEDDVDPEAFAVVFRWLGVGPMLLAVLVVVVAARRARRAPRRNGGFRD